MDSRGQLERKTLFSRLALIPSMYGLVERIRGVLSSHVFEEIKSQPNSSLLKESDLQALNTTLSNLHSAFPHTYDKFFTFEEQLRLQHDLIRLREELYDVEDALDVAATEHLMPQLPLPLHVDDLRWWNLRTMRCSLVAIFDVRQTYPSRTGKAAAVVDKMSTFRLKVKSAPPPAGFMLNSTDHGRVESPFLEFVVGRDSEKEKLTNFIFSPSNQEHPNMLLITGEAGIGKTTLGKLVCSDFRVSSGFDLVLWASDVTLDSFEHTIVKIIQSAAVTATRQSEFCQQTMARILEGQKYLLILDDFDLLLRNGIRWSKLMEIFKLGSSGSTVILISNRNHRGGKMEEIRLNPLPVRESWLLFSRCAEFDEMEEQRYSSLMKIGRSLVTECRGYPLAIKALGSTLRTSRDEHTWRHINRLFSSFPDPVSAALGISIENMPNDLMQCFLASAILFEYNVAVSKEQLLYFWMAHGLLRSSQGKKDTRDMVDAYCNQLLWRGFLQVDRVDDYHPNSGTFQMNKQVRDSAKLTIEEESAHPLDSRWIMSIGRHLLWISDGISLACPHLLRWRKKRTILIKHHIRPLVGPYDPEELISKLHLARVLWLNYSELDMLPDSIGNLKLLRYLSLKGIHRLQVLPDSLCKLVNLQTLDLSGCVQLKAIPGEMHKLVRLRHLLLSVELTSLPEEALKSWTSLHLLKICYCQHLNSLSDGIQQLTALQVLQIHECPSIASLPSSIKYLTNLKEISILDCQMLDLTGWEGLDGLTSLQFLQFQGLPNLIQFPGGLQSAGNSLRHLVVSNCQYLKTLPECLQKCNTLLEVIINNCPSIVALPRGIRAIKTLKVLKIFNCPELVSKCELGKDDWHLISHIPKIHLGHPATKGQAAEHPCHARGEPQSSSSQYYINTDVQAGAPSSAIPTTWSYPEISGNNTKASETIKKSSVSNVRLVRCPGCSEVLPEPTDVPFYRCGGCNTILQAKPEKEANEVGKIVVESSSSVQHFIYEKENEVGKFVVESSSSVQHNEVQERADGAPSHVEVLNIQGDEIVMENEYSMFDPSSDDESQDWPKTMDENELSNDIIMEEIARDLSPKYRTLEEITCCSIFFLLPEDYQFQEDTLIQLWMAAGYIKDEVIGQKYFHSLFNDEYLLRCGTDFVTGKERFQINIKKVKELLDNNSFHLQWGNESPKYSKSTEIQHLSLVCNDIDASIFQTLEQFNELRTLLFLRNYGNKVSQIPDHLFQSFKELRALDLSRTSIKKLPSSVGCMIRLCYLDLSGTSIEWLPDIICSLEELQTLKLRGCSKLRGLPRQLKKLTKLRHLDVDVLRQLATIPAGIGALVSLRSLSAFLVSTEDGCKIQELKELNSLTGEFCIAMLENVGNADEAREAALNKKQHIMKLELRWTASQSSRTENNCYDVLEYLQPCSSLKELQIFCYEGSTFPNWIGDPTFDQIVSVTFFNCQHVSELPPIEQLPFLKHLELVKMNGVKKIERRGKSEQAAFFSLEKLEVDEMQSLRSWNWTTVNERDFNSLAELTINGCPRLDEFHVLQCLSSVKHLEIRECPKMESLSVTKLPDSLEDLIVEDCPQIKKKCAQQGGEDWYKIQHVSNIRIGVDDDDDFDDDVS